MQGLPHLSYACFGKNIVKYLVEQGADIKDRTDRLKASFDFCFGKKRNIQDHLLELGVFI